MREDEAFLMADLKHAVPRFRRLDDAVGFGEARRDRLLHIGVHAVLKQPDHGGGVGDGGRRAGHDIDLPREAIGVHEGGAAELARRRAGGVKRAVHDADELDAVHGAILRRVKLAENAGSDDGGAKGRGR